MLTISVLKQAGAIQKHVFAECLHGNSDYVIIVLVMTLLLSYGRHTANSCHWSATTKQLQYNNEIRFQVKDTARFKAKLGRPCGMKEDQNHLMELSVDFFIVSLL